MNKRRIIWDSAGIVSLIPLALLVIATSLEYIDYNNNLYLVTFWIVGAAVVINSLTLIAFTVIGFKIKIHWMWFWLLSFLILSPFSIIVFWFMKLRPLR